MKLQKLFIIGLCSIVFLFSDVYGVYAQDAASIDFSGSGSGGTTAVAPAPTAIDVLEGLKKTAEGAGLKNPTAEAPTISVFTGRILGGILALVGILFFALMIYGGIRWMLARGNTQEVEGAKETVVSAIIGLVVVSLGYVLTQFIFSVIQGAASGA